MCMLCEELSKEKLPVKITEMQIRGWYYDVLYTINYCPNCGKLIEWKSFKNKE